MSRSGDAMKKLTPQALTHERLAVLECALTALIASHHDPSSVRRLFDQIYSRHQVSRVRAGAPIEVHDAMQGLIDMLFQSKNL